MQRQLLRCSPVLLQMGMGGPGLSGGGSGNGAPGLAQGMGMGGAGMQHPNMPQRPGQTMSYSNAIHMEAERRRKLDEETRSRYYVVKEDTRGKRESGRVIGIDLGTTNSCICYIDNETKKPKVIPSPTGSWVFPTAITFDKNHEVRMFGEEARACARTSASATLCSGKRLIGRGFGELGRVQSDLSKTNILTLNEKGEVAVEIMGRTYTIVHIIAMFLRYLKNEAEKFLGEEVQLAVVSVPAYFTPQQKVATEDAALCAGFDVLEIIDEPSAACLAYTVLDRLQRDSDKETELAKREQGSTTDAEDPARASSSFASATSQPAPPPKRYVRSLVFDLGGGTLDCAVMEHDTYRQKFNLVATHGDPMLGGNDWDTVLSQHFAKQFERKWHVPIEEEDGNVGQGVAAFRNLSLEAEKAKIHFTHSTETYYGYNRAFHFSQKLRDIVPLEATLTHEEYVTMTRPLRVRCLQCLEKIFEHTGFTAADIDHILLVGAMTRDPPIRHMLQEYFGKKVAQEDTCPADYAVALGAGIRGGMLQGSFPELTANTRFVSGTVQSLREGGVLRQLWRSVRRLTSTANPNAIGTRWRGRAKGLSDDEIANYAKELVEFEATCARRLLLERAESEANFVMRRVSADSNRKQGMQEKRIMQLSEQLKFWQYMVHNFHDHEEELMRVVKELQVALDELDGLAADNVQGMTSQGTIDFSKTVAKTLRSMSGRGAEVEEAEEEGATTDAAAGQGVDHASSKAEEAASHASAPPASSASTSGPKILRRRAPLPTASSAAQSLVEAGHPALVNADIEVAESARNSFLQAQVEERAWHEPPAPPGEEGSWTEVKAAVDAGEVVGAPVPWRDMLRPMTMSEMQAALQSRFPIDDPPSPEHAAKRDLAIDLQSMTIVQGAVDMVAIQASLQQHEQDVVASEKEAERSTKEHNREMSARLFR